MTAHPSFSANNKTALDSIIVTLLNAAGQLASFILFAGIAAMFGATWETDAFFLALTIPAFFIGSVVNSITNVFIPVLTKCRVQRPTAIGQLVGSALCYVSAFSAVAAIGVVLGTPLLLKIAGQGFSVAGQRLTFDHTLVLLPMIVIQNAIGILAAAYNSAGRFWLPAGAVVIRYLSTLATIVMMRPVMGIMSVPVAFLMGSFLQLALFIVFWRKLDFRIQFGWQVAPDLRRSFRLALPLVLGMAALQLNIVVSRLLAAQLPAGSISVFDYAGRISIGIMELLTSGVMLVTLANWSQVVVQGNADQLRTKLQQTILMMLFVILPVVAVLIILREPITVLMLQRGAFDARLIADTASVMALFLLAVPLSVVGRTYVRLFLVWQDTWVLGGQSLLRFGIALLLSLGLMGFLGVQGLALADSLAITISLILLVILANRKLGNTLTGLWRDLGKLAAATLCAGAAMFFVNAGLEHVALWLTLPCTTATGLAIYLATAKVLHVPQLLAVFRLTADLSPITQWRRYGTLRNRL